MSQMHNPFAEERCRTVFEIGKGVSTIFIAGFMLMLILPALGWHVYLASQGQWKESPAARLLSWRPGQQDIVHHLREVEKATDKAGYSVALRQKTQSMLLEYADEGNLKTYLGWEGWLFYHPDLKALTGYGPIKPEPFSVMKDPELGKVPETRELIIEYAAQLKERGIDLLLVPVPLKPMIYNEQVAPQSLPTWVTHPDAPAFYSLLRKNGVDVLDLTQDLSKLRGERKRVFYLEANSQNREIAKESEEALKLKKDAFLKQDTHWTPDAMRLAAEKVADHVKARYPQALGPGFHTIRAVDGVHRSSLGDLVKLLDLKDPYQFFDEEEVFLNVIGEGTQNTRSSLVLLGDSFVNIYDDPTLGFENPEKPDELIRAGFAQHLSLLLQRPLDVIAKNGQGSTAVRQELARRPDDEVREKKLVIWVIAARDVLLSTNAARAANITWARVKFSEKTSSGAAGGVSQDPAAPAGDLVVEATLTEKSANQDPNGTPYTNALHTATYEVGKVVSGAMEGKQILGVQWTFKEKQMQPTAAFAQGKRYRLTLVPWDVKKEKEPAFGNFNLSDESTAFDAERWFVEKAEEIP